MGLAQKLKLSINNEMSISTSKWSRAVDGFDCQTLYGIQRRLQCSNSAQLMLNWLNLFAARLCPKYICGTPITTLRIQCNEDMKLP